MLIPALKKTYKEQTVLDFPGMEIPDGSIVAVCGHNGSGKSTLAKILAGIIKADEHTTFSSQYHVGYMNQHPLAFKLSVKNNLLQNADPAASRAEALLRADTLLKALELDKDEKKKAHKLSGGQIERMALARILMKNYDLLILDEPTASMDQSTIPQAEKLIRDYQAQTGCTILIITHAPDQASRLADQVITLEDGKIKNTVFPG